MLFSKVNSDASYYLVPLPSFSCLAMSTNYGEHYRIVETRFRHSVVHVSNAQVDWEMIY